MLSWIFQITIISILLIFLLDHLIKFFTNTLTIPKIKDLVRDTNKKYSSIYETLANSEILSSNNPNYKDKSILENSTDIENLPPSYNSNEKKENMKNELKYFFKNQLSGSDLEKNEFSYSNPEYFQFK